MKKSVLLMLIAALSSCYSSAKNPISKGITSHSGHAANKCVDYDDDEFYTKMLLVCEDKENPEEEPGVGYSENKETAENAHLFVFSR